MAEFPWVKVFPSDLLNGIVDLDAEQRGVYLTIMAMIWDRGAPLPDDAQWLARRCGTSTRGFRRVRDSLIAEGKLEMRNGFIANRRALESVKQQKRKSDQARAAAWARWHGDESSPPEPEKPHPELPLEGERNDQSLAKKTAEKQRVFSPKNSKEMAENGEIVDADACFSRARARPRGQKYIETDERSPPTPARAREAQDQNHVNPLEDTDLASLWDAVQDASGYRPAQPGQIARAFEFITKWRDLGIDFETIVLPVIRRTLIEQRDKTTGSLARFDKQILAEHAAAKAQSLNGHTHRPVAEPVFNIPGEADEFEPLRRKLCDAMGTHTYSMICRRITFEALTQGDARIIRINGPASSQMLDGENLLIITRIARASGFDKVW